MFKRVGLIVFIAVAAIGLALAGTLLWATSAPGSRTLSRWVRESLVKQTGLDVTFAKIDLDLFPPRVRIRDATARDVQGRVVCTVAEAEMAPDPLDLFRSRFTVDEISVGAPRCMVKLTAKDVDALRAQAQAQPAGAKPAGIDLSAVPRFDVFAVTDGFLDAQIDDEGRTGRLHLTVDGLGLDVTGTEASIEVRGLVDRIRGTWQKGDKKVDESVVGLEFRTAVSGNAVDVRHLNAVAGGARIRVRDAHVPVPLWPAGPEVADLSVDVPLDLAQRLPLGLPTFTGKASFLGQVSAREGADKRIGVFARGQVGLAGVTVDGRVVGDLDGRVSLTPKGVALAATRVRIGDGVVTVDGSVAFDEGLTTEVSARLERVELARLLEGLKLVEAQVTQRMSGTARAKGRLRPLKLDGAVDLTVEDHTVWAKGFRSKANEIILHAPTATVRGRISATDRYFAAPDLDVRVGSTELAVNTRFNFDATWLLVAKSRMFHLEDLQRIAGFDVQGRGPLTCRISGLLWEPHIVGSASFDQFSFAGLKFGHAETGVSFSHGNLSFDGLTVRTRDSRYAASEVRLEFGGRTGLRIETKMDIERLAISDLADTFHLDLSRYGAPEGELFGRVAIDYTLRPKHLDIQVNLTHDKLRIFGERFGADVARGSWVDGDLTVAELGLTKGRGTISVTGAAMRDGSLNFIGVASELELKSIDNKQVRALGLEGAGQAFVVLGGTVGRPVGTADVRLGGTRRKGVEFGPSALKIALDGRVMTASGKLCGDLATLEYARLDLDTRAFAVEGFVYELDAISHLGLDAGGHRAKALITGEIALRGRVAARPELFGHGNLERVHVTVDNIDFENTGTVHLDVAKNRFRLKRARFEGPRQVFDLWGDAGTTGLDLKVRGLADLGALDGLFDAVDKSRGELTFSGRVTGSPSSPIFRGEADIENGMVKLASFPHAIENLGGRILLRGRQVLFQGFTAETADGKLAADGFLKLDGLAIADYGFTLSLDGLRLAPLEDLSFIASGRLELAPGKAGLLPTVRGDVDVSAFRYTKDIRVLELSDLDLLTGRRLTTQKTHLYDRKEDVFAFDVRLHGTKDLVARNNLFDAALRIDDTDLPLRIVGTNQSFGFLGRIVGTDGQIRFAGKRFKLESASVEFTDRMRPDNPKFHVVAGGQVRDWRVTMTADGTVAQYAIKLTSEPFLSQEDIAFLLLTGMTKAEHRQFGSSGAGAGVAILDQLGPGGEAIPLELQVYNEYSERAGTDTTRVSLGKWLTEDIWVAVSSSVGQERDIEANVDYKINDHFSVEGGYENDNEGQVGNLGLDLKFRLEF
ncbi:MAG: translocation/assembly module TamB domain-containing protein [Deltaproteobacteria bacterium]|nr:translocation/assembly module TamB domain-containing protein [Deltaproteobacteria bacterium]